MILIYGLILPSAGRNKVKLEIIVEIKRPSDATKNDLTAVFFETGAMSTLTK